MAETQEPFYRIRGTNRLWPCGNNITLKLHYVNGSHEFRPPQPEKPYFCSQDCYHTWQDATASKPKQITNSERRHLVV